MPQVRPSQPTTEAAPAARWSPLRLALRASSANSRSSASMTSRRPFGIHPPLVPGLELGERRLQLLEGRAPLPQHARSIPNKCSDVKRLTQARVSPPLLTYPPAGGEGPPALGQQGGDLRGRADWVQV